MADEKKPTPNLSGNLKAICQNNKWGYINENGDLIIPFQFDKACDFKLEGYAFVVIGGRIKIINQAGTFI